MCNNFKYRLSSRQYIHNERTVIAPTATFLFWVQLCVSMAAKWPWPKVRRQTQSIDGGSQAVQLRRDVSLHIKKIAKQLAKVIRKRLKLIRSHCESVGESDSHLFHK